MLDERMKVIISLALGGSSAVTDRRPIVAPSVGQRHIMDRTKNGTLHMGHHARSCLKPVLHRARRNLHHGSHRCILVPRDLDIGPSLPLAPWLRIA